MRPAGLGRHPGFMKLWIGQAISSFGSWLGAFPLLAILVLDVTPAQMGVLETLRAAPVLLVGLLAGVWIDRMRRRHILMLADIGRALLLGSIPMAALLGLLRMEQLYVVGFLNGILTVFFDTAFQSYIPTLVQRERLLEANSRLSASSSVAEIAAPALGGVLVQLITAPLTVLLDAVSFLVSALFLGLIRTPEPPPAHQEQGPSMWHDIVEGLRLVLRNPVLRALAGGEGTHNFFGAFFGTLYGLYAIRELGLEPATVGVLVGSGGIGALVGTLLAGQVTGRFGLGPSLIGGLLASSVLALLMPLAGGTRLVAVSLLAASQVLGDLALAIFFITELSLRQAITPDHVLGRVNASFRFIVGGTGILGLFAGGILGETIGLRPSVAVAAAGGLLACLWLPLSPVGGMHEPPRPRL
jgi:MFS family permease